jgi:hypothetical protein
LFKVCFGGKMKKMLVKFAVLSGMLLGLPLTGVLISGRPLSLYLAFPPQQRYVPHAAFSWCFFAGYAVLIAFLFLFFLWPFLSGRRRADSHPPAGRPLPWWGWVSTAACLVFWGVAWTRFSFLSRLQAYTFTPLWLAFIFVLNALTYRRSGRCMLTHKTGRFVGLFPLSALFWWYFEYLNRFVQNWHYAGVEFEPLAYFTLATFSFSTVLPAVASMRELLCSYDPLKKRYAVWLRYDFPRSKPLAWAVLLLAGIGLLLIGILPNFLFALLWVSPLLIVVSLDTIQGQPHIFSDIARGKWDRIAAYAFAALFCGFFWEMWNQFSLAKWQYSIPFVHRFQIFEMPVLGYAGYLPFGLECAVMVEMIDDMLDRKKRFIFP